MAFDPDEFLARAEGAPAAPAAPPDDPATRFARRNLGPNPNAPLVGDAAPELAAALRPSAGSSFGTGLAQGASFGFADEAQAAVNALTQGHGGSISGTYRAERDRERRATHEAADAHPLAFGAGVVGGGLATMAIPGAGTLGIAGKGLGAAAARGAVAGAAGGLGSSEADTVGAMALDTLAGGVVGGIAGGAVHAVGTGAAKLVQGAQGRIDKRTLGDIAERVGGTLKAKLAAKADDVVETARSFGLGKVARDPAALAEQAGAARTAVGERIGAIYQRADAAAEGGGIPLSKVMQALHGVEKEYAANPATRSIAKKIGDQIEDIRSTWQGTNVHRSMARIPASDVRAMVTAMQDSAFASAEIAPRVGIRAARDAAGAVRGVIEEHVGAGSRAALGELRDLNRQYAALSLIGQAAEKRVAAARLAPSGPGKLRLGAALAAGAHGNIPAAIGIAAGPELVRGLARGGDRALAALVRLAQSGGTAADVLSQGARMGIPRATAAAVARLAPRALEEASP